MTAKKKSTTHTGLYCNCCGETIFSWDRHDFRWCSCGSLFVDGGFDYFRCGGAGVRVKDGEFANAVTRTFTPAEVAKYTKLALAYKPFTVE